MYKDGGYYSHFQRGDKIPMANKLPGILISLFFSVLICIPIFLMLRLTKKKEYRFTTETEDT